MHLVLVWLPFGEVTKDGIVLYARPELILGQKENLKHYISYKFQWICLTRIICMWRGKIYGYQVKSVHQGKEYYKWRKREIVQEHGNKMGKATFLIDAAHFDTILNLFQEKKVKYKLTKVWRYELTLDLEFNNSYNRKYLLTHIC